MPSRHLFEQIQVLELGLCTGGSPCCVCGGAAAGDSDGQHAARNRLYALSSLDSASNRTGIRSPALTMASGDRGTRSSRWHE